MNLNQLKETLAAHADKTVRFVLPTGTRIPPHAHVTEVAQVDKRFIDCGGTFRTDSVCRLQTWFQDDTDHRLSAGKLLAILEKSRSVLTVDSLDVEVEHEAPFIAQFPIDKIETGADSLFVHLGTKHTACLAEDRCIPVLSKAEPIFKPIPSLETKGCCAGAC